MEKKQLAEDDLSKLNKRFDELSDEEYLKVIYGLLDIKELELPICLMVNRIARSLLTKEESENTDAEMVQVVKELHQYISELEVEESFNPVAIIDAMAYIMLTLHIYIMDNSKEYKEYSDKLRALVLSGSYIRKEDFFDPSVA